MLLQQSDQNLIVEEHSFDVQAGTKQFEDGPAHLMLNASGDNGRYDNAHAQDDGNSNKHTFDNVPNIEPADALEGVSELIWHERCVGEHGALKQQNAVELQCVLETKGIECECQLIYSVQAA